MLQRVHVVDSHTGGEPTRTIIDGGPDLGVGDLQQRRLRLQQDHETFRRALVTEPRGSKAMVGALLCEPSHPDCATGVIFFNNSGCLGMCGHGTIGLVVTLAYLGRIKPGRHRIETPVGIVGATLHPDGKVTFENVPSYRWAAAVQVEVPGYGQVTGDVAWGGNWFFLTKHHPYRSTAPISISSSTSPGPFGRRSLPTGFKARRAPRSTTSNSTALGLQKAWTAAISYCVRARSTTDPPAAPAPAPS